MKIYDSVKRDIVEFAPIEDKRIVIYVCGLTPYDEAHIGHARTYVSFDIMKRYFVKRGYRVFHIQNITDVEDKIINRCKETGADPKKLTEKNHAEALGLFDRLHITRADAYPKVSEHMDEIVALIKKLVDRGYAYGTETGVYFDVSKFKNYGKLSGQNMKEIRAGARVEVDETKESPEDFALWKKGEDIMAFDSPWGRGRPGWHIECSAMSMKYAKRETLDIHGGARDLIFPHHENEIAQSEAATGKPFSKYWMHTGFLTVHGEKMSKSLGNFITVKDALKRFSPNALRFFYIQSHYRSPVDYDEKAISSMEEGVDKIFNTLRGISESRTGNLRDDEFRKKADAETKRFYEEMENDFDTPGAIAALFGLIRTVNSHLGKERTDSEALEGIKEKIEEILWILGLEKEAVSLDGKKKEIAAVAAEFRIRAGPKPEETIAALAELRETSRKKKDYAASDSIRKRLKDIGIVLEDKKEGGTGWRIE
ncbi:cysteine--tRNA ligase [Candidatus Micrarchaeota archaeon]|nr:cysteine--tRNA ligase [Candidatus Micrarchaeota archaeon]